MKASILRGIDIKSVSGNVITLDGNLVNSGYDADLANDKIVQVIQIKQFSKFTLNGGIVTCHPWDGETGGIVVAQINGDFIVNSATNPDENGKVLASGRGFFPEELNGNDIWGEPGQVGAGDPSVGIGGVGTNGSNGGSGNYGPLPCNDPSCFDYVSPMPTIVLGYDGGIGGICSGCDGSPGTLNGGTLVTYAGSYLNSQFCLGNAGYFPSGSGAGNGGDGGGAGAGGGASKGPQGQNGSDGEPGEDGGDGGKPGEGARGGGSIYLKAKNFVMNHNNAVFYADGVHGDYGRIGEYGGSGGNGGSGGQGYCDGDFYRSGGSGGNGKSGVGAQGGDGGNGGEPGYIWCVEDNSTKSLVASHFSVEGGKAGRAGLGNYPSHIMNDCGKNILEDFGTCSNIFKCADVCPRVIEECDCEKAYKQLAKADPSTTGFWDNTAENRYEFYDVNGNLVAWYNYLETELVGVRKEPCVGGDITYYYRCPKYDKANCDEIFESIFNQSTNYVEFSFDPAQNNIYEHTGTNGYEFSIVEDNENVLDEEKYFTYVHENGYVYEQYYESGELRCYDGPCSISSMSSSYQGEPGDVGVKATDGTISSSNSANAPLDIGSFKKGTGLSDEYLPNELSVTLSPNPLSQTLRSSISGFEKGSQLRYVIYDNSGKKLIDKTIASVLHDKYELRQNVTMFKKGVYYLLIQSSAKRTITKFLKY